jgi:hypothetical protein
MSIFWVLLSLLISPSAIRCPNHPSSTEIPRASRAT